MVAAKRDEPRSADDEDDGLLLGVLLVAEADTLVEVVES